MVLVPTQLTPGRIKATDRHLKFGVLGLYDDHSLDNVVDLARVRVILLKNAVKGTYKGSIVGKLMGEKAVQAKLDEVVV